ncbi:hypothetical protein [Vreelandella utahensis]|uniref:hypothetical protein n=1 Tax=Vreelandella halophila TaxID=86177 RepID=UPI000987B4D8|nr:hypothetical protein [Halomonas utahensis]
MTPERWDKPDDGLKGVDWIDSWLLQLAYRIRYLRNQRIHQSVKRDLASLDDKLLCDIGLSRHDVH